MPRRFLTLISLFVAILAVLLLVIAIVSAWYVHNLQRSVSSLLANNVSSVTAAQELEISIREVSMQFNRYLITLKEEYLKPIPHLRARTEAALAEAERTAYTPPEQVLMQRARRGYDHFFQEYNQILSERGNWKFERIIELVDNVLYKEILDPSHEYLRLNEGMLSLTSQTNEQLADRITTGLIAMGLCGSIGGLLGGAVIAITIRRSLIRTEQEMRSTAEKLQLAAQKVPAPQKADTESPYSGAMEQMKVSATAVLKRLRQTERDALRAEQLAWVGQMAAGVAHEIRNPLMAIKILVQATVERRGDSLFKKRDLDVLEEEILRLEQIVKGFLDFARPPQLEPRPFDCKEVFERAIEGIKSRAEIQGVAIKIDPVRGPTVINADPNQMRQVIFNLLFNALDAQPNGGHITIRFQRVESLPGEPELVITVADGGPGISPQVRERLFEPFVSTKESGLGLGLSICRRILESHGGTLTVESTDAGATFILRLPILRNGYLAPAQHPLLNY